MTTRGEKVMKLPTSYTKNGHFSHDIRKILMFLHYNCFGSTNKDEFNKFLRPSNIRVDVKGNDFPNKLVKWLTLGSYVEDYSTQKDIKPELQDKDLDSLIKITGKGLTLLNELEKQNLTEKQLRIAKLNLGVSRCLVWATGALVIATFIIAIRG